MSVCVCVCEYRKWGRLCLSGVEIFHIRRLRRIWNISRRDSCTYNRLQCMHASTLRKQWDTNRRRCVRANDEKFDKMLCRIVSCLPKTEKPIYIRKIRTYIGGKANREKYEFNILVDWVSWVSILPSSALCACACVRAHPFICFSARNVQCRECGSFEPSMSARLIYHIMCNFQFY